jgi:hypothetical protein
MPPAAPSFEWQEAILAFGLVALAAFLVSYVFTDRLEVRRAAYVGVLLVVSLGLGVGYLLWSETSLHELVVADWARGLIAGLVTAAVLFPLVRRLPSGPLGGGTKSLTLLWEGAAYGTAEAILLATLPVLAIWQATQDLGWSNLLGSTLAVLGGLFVVLVHHLGYAEFRRHAARTKLAGALLACGLQALAFVLTGNVLAPVLAHVLLHCQMILRGVELPPIAIVHPEAHLRTRDARDATTPWQETETLARPVEMAGSALPRHRRDA